MKNRIEYEHERRQAAELLETYNRRASIHFAEMLRKQDEYERVCKELGIPVQEIIPKRYFEITYRVLSLGKLQDRATLLLGTVNAIDKLLSEIDSVGGFRDERGFFVEVPEL